MRVRAFTDVSGAFAYRVYALDKRSRRIKDHKVLQDIAKENPDTEDILEDNLIDNQYPQRPQDVEDICLYDFVANYDWQSKDSSGNRKYKKLTKSRLPNHKLYDPANENQREDYYYSDTPFHSVQREVVCFSRTKPPKKHFTG